MRLLSHLLFATSLISLTLSVISYIIDFNLANFIPSIIGAALGLAIGMYFLFEIRTYFKDGSKAVKSSDTTKA